MVDNEAELDQLRAENARLKAYISNLTNPLAETTANGSSPPSDACPIVARPWDGGGHGLNREQVGRYSRQIILPSFGVDGNKLIKYIIVFLIPRNYPEKKNIASSSANEHLCN